MSTHDSTLDELFDAQAAAPRRPRWRRRLVTMLVVVALLFGGMWVATWVAKIPTPITLAKLLTTDPSAQGSLFASRSVAAPDRPRRFEAAVGRRLPRDVPWKGERIGVRDMLERTHTKSFLVIQNGRVVSEQYFDGVGAETRLSSWSVAKSLISLLVGQVIEAGDLAESDRMVDLLPDFEVTGDSAYNDITLRDLLDMTAAIDVAENYREYWPFTGTARLFISTDLRAYLRSHREVTDLPGTTGDYRSVETQMLALILSEVEGRDVATQLSDQIWQPIGAEHDATWSLDRAGGTEKGFCCLNATTRDFAKVGQLVLDGGRVGTEQVVPAAWIERISTPARHRVDEWGYSAQWWHPTGSTDDLVAIGVYGQYIYVNPATGTVIVKLSDHGTEQDELDTVDAMRAISVELALQSPPDR